MIEIKIIYFFYGLNIFPNDKGWGPFHKSSYERFLLYEFVMPVINYGFNEFVAFTNLCETGPWSASEQLGNTL